MTKDAVNKHHWDYFFSSIVSENNFTSISAPPIMVRKNLGELFSFYLFREIRETVKNRMDTHVSNCTQCEYLKIN